MECSPFRADGAGGAQAGLRAPSIETPLESETHSRAPPPLLVSGECIASLATQVHRAQSFTIAREVFGLLASVKVAPSEGELESTIGASRDDLVGSQGGEGFWREGER